MAKSAVIGALRVDLGLNSAEFTAGLKSAQANLGKFGKALSVGFAAAAAAATAAGVAIGFAVKGAIDHADELGKTAQKIGLSVEALSRLEYAAKLSDVELAGLTGGLRKLSQEIVSGNKGFAALGINVKDASGKFRSTDAVFADVADRFSRMEDGALKTSLALQLFGRSGADLIPLLNGGADGLKRYADEADRLGATISTSTAGAAEEFNDTITRIEATLGGVVNKVMDAALPALQEFADVLASPQFAEAASTLATNVIGALADIVSATADVINGLKAINDWLLADGSAGASQPLSEILDANQRNKLRSDLGNVAGPFPISTPGNLYEGFNFGANGKMNVAKPAAGTSSFIPVISGAKAATDSVTDLMAGLDDAQPKVESFAKTIGDTMANAFSGMADAVMSGVSPLQALGNELGNIGKQLLNSAISNFFGNLFGGGFGGGASLGTNRSLLGMPLFADGGVTNGPAIFGEAGPEAAVPLPDGRSIPVTLSGNAGGGGGEVLVRLGPGLVGEITKQTEAQTIKLIDSRAPAAVAKTQRNRGM